MTNKTIVLLLLCSLTTLTSLKSQLYELGAFGGVTSYQGDLAARALVLKQMRPSAGFVVRYTPLSFMAIRGGATFGAFKAADADNTNSELAKRGFAVKRNIREMSLISEFHLPHYSKSGWGMFKPRFSPFAFIGIGLSALDGQPTAPADLTPYPFPEPGAKSTFIVVPFGGGIKYHFAKNIAMSAEWGSRFTFNDYVDGVSKSANPAAHDYYMFAGIGITYVVGWDGDSPFGKAKW